MDESGRQQGAERQDDEEDQTGLPRMAVILYRQAPLSREAARVAA
jgi:hypothetical protein